MAKRFTDTDKFSDTWYRKLCLLQKVIWEYLLAECDYAGILKNFDLEMMSFKIGAEVTKKDLEIFENRIIFISDDVIFIPNFIKFQYGELNPNNKIHSSIIKELNRYNIDFYTLSKGFGTLIKGLDNSLDTLSIPLTKGIDRVKEKEKEKDKDKEEEKEQDIFISSNKKINDPYINPIKNFFSAEYQKVFNAKPFLNNADCNRLVELSAEFPNIREHIPIALERLKRINFDDINFTPTASWLLKGNNFERVMNGEFEPKQLNQNNDRKHIFKELEEKAKKEGII